MQDSQSTWRYFFFVHQRDEANFFDPAVRKPFSKVLAGTRLDIRVVRLKMIDPVTWARVLSGSSPLTPSTTNMRTVLSEESYDELALESTYTL